MNQAIYQLSRQTDGHAVLPLGGVSPVTLPAGMTFQVVRTFRNAAPSHRITEIISQMGHMTFRYHVPACRLYAR